jgi:Phytanoyl-CoA dioxygenase (PhyH)
MTTTRKRKTGDDMLNQDQNSTIQTPAPKRFASALSLIDWMSPYAIEPTFRGVEKNAKTLGITIPSTLGRNVILAQEWIAAVKLAKEKKTWDWPWNEYFSSTTCLTPSLNIPSQDKEKGQKAEEGCDKKLWESRRNFFGEHGWVLIPGVCDEKAMSPWKQEFLKAAEKECPEMKKDDRKTYVHWAIKHFLGQSVEGMEHSPWMWQARKATYPAWSKFWGTTDLLASYDCGKFHAAGQLDLKTMQRISAELNRDKRKYIRDEYLTSLYNTKVSAKKEEFVLDWTHSDRGKSSDAFNNAVQGMLLLTDSGPEDGGLVMLDKSHTIHDEYLRTHPEQEHNGPNKMTLRLAKELYPFVTPVKICGKAGDLLIWDARTYHFGIPGKLFRTGTPGTMDKEYSEGRLCLYIAMHPRACASEMDLLARVEAYERGEPAGHVCVGPDWSDKYLQFKKENFQAPRKNPRPQDPVLRKLIGYED